MLGPLVLKTANKEAEMATRKKKEIANVPSGGWPKMQQGTHLTVKTFEDGKTELIWDWDALVSEVRAACLKAESKIPVTTEVEVKPKRKKSKTN
jgi:hypothetical protein